jgi:hypothetical protein
VLKEHGKDENLKNMAILKYAMYICHKFFKMDPFQTLIDIPLDKLNEDGSKVW